MTRAHDKDAVARLYRLKQRERKPGTVLAASVAQLVDLGVDPAALQAVSHLWPNPLSIVITTDPKAAYLDQGLGDLAVRIPRHTQLRQLLERIGPLLSSSANHPGEQPAATIQQARAYFGDAVDFYVDGGDLGGRPSSTVARVTDGHVTILRPGAVTIDDKGNII